MTMASVVPMKDHGKKQKNVFIVKLSKNAVTNIVSLSFMFREKVL